ncbi:MAG: sulfatase [Planctomycetaceae bacterium]|nr:sulfatase [Planctomycetaceae bacterium]
MSFRIILLACCSLFPLCSLQAEEKPARNVVLIVADDMGFQIGCYGNKVIQTPNMDKLAAEGTKFTHAYCTTASCSASRSVLMTGLHNHTTGHYGHAHSYNHFSTFESVKSLPVMMNEAGYRTCSIGKYHLAPEYTYHFEDYRNQGVQGNRNSAVMADNAKEWIAEAPEKPFFLYWCSSDPHRGGGPGGFSNFNADAEHYPGIEQVLYKADDITPPGWLPQTVETQTELAEYYQAINRFDQGVGKLVQHLKDLGVYDNTLIMVTSDNGPPFPGAKTCLYNPGMNLPLIVRSPDQEKTGVTTNAKVNWTDMVPTILDYCQVTPKPVPAIKRGENRGAPNFSGKTQPAKFHGKSFLPALEQEKPEGFDAVFASHTFHEITMYYPMRVYIKGEYKLIFNIAHQLPYPFASDLYASPTWQSVLNNGGEMFGKRPVYDYLHRPRFELYNITDDYLELNNLATDLDHQKLLNKMQEELQAFQKKTKDPWELKWTYE